MTTFTFRQPAGSPFSFQPTLDGQVYNATVPWLVFGARYYLSLTAIDGTPILYTAIAGSPTGLDLQALGWSAGRVQATTLAPHGYRLGRLVALTVSGCAPDTFNGLVQALITGPTTFTYALAADPGPATVLGRASYNVNLVGGVPNAAGVAFTSTLVFRQANQQFEVSP